MQYIKNKRHGKKHVSYSYKTNTKNAGNKRQWSDEGKRYIPRIPVYSLYAYKKNIAILLQATMQLSLAVI